MVEMGQTWTDAGTEDFEDYLMAETDADNKKKPKSPEKAKAAKDEKKK